MPGRPLQRRLAAQIQHEGAEDEILDAIAEGKSLASVGRKYDVSVRTMRRWINEDEGRARRYAEARQIAAEAYDNRAGRVLSDAAKRPDLSSAQATIASQRSGYYRWKAGVLDRDTYGEKAQQQVNVQVNVGDLHLDALRAVCTQATKPSEPIAEAEYETVSEE